jgi:hypothetical protein
MKAPTAPKSATETAPQSSNTRAAAESTPPSMTAQALGRQVLFRAPCGVLFGVVC